MCWRLCELSQRCPWSSGPSRAAVPVSVAVLWNGSNPAGLGAEVNPHPHPCPPVLPVSSLLHCPCWPFLLLLPPFLPLAELWERLCSLLEPRKKPWMSSRVQFRICCEDRNPRERGESEPRLGKAGSHNPRPCCISQEDAQEWQSRQERELNDPFASTELLGLAVCCPYQWDKGPLLMDS